MRARLAEPPPLCAATAHPINTIHYTHAARTTRCAQPIATLRGTSKQHRNASFALGACGTVPRGGRAHGDALPLTSGPGVSLAALALELALLLSLEETLGGGLGDGDVVDEEADAALGDDVRDAVAELDAEDGVGAGEAEHG